jgi:hypothetical protein
MNQGIIIHLFILSAIQTVNIDKFYYLTFTIVIIVRQARLSPLTAAFPLVSCPTMWMTNLFPIMWMTNLFRREWISHPMIHMIGCGWLIYSLGTGLVIHIVPSLQWKSEFFYISQRLYSLHSVTLCAALAARLQLLLTGYRGTQPLLWLTMI